MEGLRRHLRAWSFAWLLCQAAFLSAFVPRDCCAAHGSHAGKGAECHRTVENTHCPMPSADGTACPMHQKGAKEDDCRLRGTCDGPLVALAHLFSYASLPLAPVSVAMATPPVQIVGQAAENAIQQATPPDSPPPRA